MADKEYRAIIAEVNALVDAIIAYRTVGSYCSQFGNIEMDALHGILFDRIEMVVKFVRYAESTGAATPELISARDKLNAIVASHYNGWF